MVTLSSGSLKHLFYSLEAEWGAEDSHSNSVGRNAGLHLNLSFRSSILAPLLWKMASPTHQKPTSSLQIVTKCSTEIKPKHTSMDAKKIVEPDTCVYSSLWNTKNCGKAVNKCSAVNRQWTEDPMVGFEIGYPVCPCKTPKPNSLQSEFRSCPCAKGKYSI